MTQNSFFDDAEEKRLEKSFHSLSTIHLEDKELSDYVEDKASLFTQMRVEAHLAQCDFCRDELEMLKELRQEGPGELDWEMDRQIRKLLAYIPVHVFTTVTKQANTSTSIYDIGRLEFLFAALGVQGKTTSDWAKPIFSEDERCVWTYREDSQRNLIFKFTVFLPEPKAMQLEAAGQVWEFPLKPEGKEWIAEATIPSQVRSRLRRGDDIQIRIING